jgi:prepilin-type N-terminal cleavage/methylation domain-containing protein
MIRFANHSKGFTLIEVCIVISIVSIMLAIATPMFMSWVPGAKLRGAVQELYADMQRAKSTAIKDNKDVTFSFTPQGLSADGTCTGGSYTFTDTDGNVIASKNFTGTDFCLAKVIDNNLSPPIPATKPATDFPDIDGDGVTLEGGFSSRGLPTTSPPPPPSPTTRGIALTDNSSRSPAVFIVTQSMAGGVIVERY